MASLFRLISIVGAGVALWMFLVFEKPSANPDGNDVKVFSTQTITPVDDLSAHDAMADTFVSRRAGTRTDTRVIPAAGQRLGSYEGHPEARDTSRESIELELKNYLKKLPSPKTHLANAKADLHGHAGAPSELIRATTDLMQLAATDVKVARAFSGQLEACSLGSQPTPDSVRAYCLENLKVLSESLGDEAITEKLERVLKQIPESVARIFRAADRL